MNPKQTIARLRYIRWTLLALLFGFVLYVMYTDGMGEWYATRIFPSIATVLSGISSQFSFSIGDVFIYGSIVLLLVYLIFAIVRRKGFLIRLRNIAEYLLWVYVWFYMAWGLNYFRDNFYQRTQITPVAFSYDEFQDFLADYTSLLNETFVVDSKVELSVIEAEVKKGYESIAEEFAICEPRPWQQSKTMLFSSLMSMVGVRGYIGPFFNEFHLNKDLRIGEQPSVYAHEMSHVLGISNEAEANLLAYLVCTNSKVPVIRFAGYFSVLPYMLSNARRLLSEKDYNKWLETVDPEVKKLYNDRQVYWRSLYSPLIGEVQDKMYNLYLKGNKIPSGTANYSEVVALLMAYQQNAHHNLKIGAE